MKLPRNYQVIRCCNLFNDYSSPSKPRTDGEHRRCRKASKKVVNYMRKHFRENVDYKEFSNGMLWPMTRILFITTVRR